MEEQVAVEDFYIDYGKMDALQRKYVDKKVNKGMVVCGAAGTGKSLIALHKAKQVAQLGSYAIVVYTKTLRRYFEDGLRTLQLKNVYHYHYWKRLKEENRFPHVKYLIVDECQDFTSQEIDELKSSADICFFFGDSAQSIMNFRGPVQSVQQTAIGMGEIMLPLQTNYRLTKENARLAEYILPNEDIVDNCVRSGVKPQLINGMTFDIQLDKAIDLIRNQSLTSVGILMPFNTKEKAMSYLGNEKMSVEYVKDYFLRKGVPCEYKYDDLKETELELNFYSTTPKIMTWWCAKGLQFKDVFLLNCNYLCKDEDIEHKRNAVFVAATRTSERLYVAYTGSLSSFFPDANSDIFLQHQSDDDILG